MCFFRFAIAAGRAGRCLASFRTLARLEALEEIEERKALSLEEQIEALQEEQIEALQEEIEALEEMQPMGGMQPMGAAGGMQPMGRMQPMGAKEHEALEELEEEERKVELHALEEHEALQDMQSQDMQFHDARPPPGCEDRDGWVDIDQGGWSMFDWNEDDEKIGVDEMTELACHQSSQTIEYLIINELIDQAISEPDPEPEPQQQIAEPRGQKLGLNRRVFRRSGLEDGGRLVVRCDGMLVSEMTMFDLRKSLGRRGLDVKGRKEVLQSRLVSNWNMF